MFDSSDFIPEPTLVLMGCRAWPPSMDPEEFCPVCDQGVNEGDNRTYCAWCDSVSPVNEAKARAALIGRSWSSKSEVAEARLKSRLPRKRLLSERARRLIWNGYRHGIASEAPNVDSSNLSDVANLTKVGRDWLASIGQAPDWSLILDAKGKVVGRYEPAEDLEVELGAGVA